MTSLARKAMVTRWILIVTYIDMLVLFTVKTLLWPSEGREPNVTIWLFHVVPLLVFLPGLIRKNRRHYVGLCYVTLVYFIASGGNIFNSTVHIYDWLTVVFSVIIYVAGLMGSRWQGQLDAIENGNKQ